MSGRVYPSGAVYLIGHALLGSALPLIYTISLRLQLETLGTQPIDGLETSLDLCVPVLLCGELSLRLRSSRS